MRVCDSDSGSAMASLPYVRWNLDRYVKRILGNAFVVYVQTEGTVQTDTPSNTMTITRGHRGARLPPKGSAPISPDWRGGTGNLTMRRCRPRRLAVDQ